MTRRLVLLVSLCLSPALFLKDISAEDIVIDTSMSIETHRVFGPEHPGLYKHPASITELAGGDLYIAYYGGAGEYSSETAVFGVLYTTNDRSTIMLAEFEEKAILKYEHE